MANPSLDSSDDARHSRGNVHDSSRPSDVQEHTLCFISVLAGVLLPLVLVLLVLGHAVLASSIVQSALIGHTFNIFKIAGHVFQRRAWPHSCATRHYPLWRRLLEAFCIGLTWPCWVSKA